ncbi:hypothetical protein AB6A40_010321 [Gnathostoma spinigerum]|uniref:Uncharacterized protein n=1 Tax=Gnathostoma spinigerum TaxID=75299 RepID=A0ABD6F290_9BILA
MVFSSEHMKHEKECVFVQRYKPESEFTVRDVLYLLAANRCQLAGMHMMELLEKIALHGEETANMYERFSRSKRAHGNQQKDVLRT